MSLDPDEQLTANNDSDKTPVRHARRTKSMDMDTPCPECHVFLNAAQISHTRTTRWRPAVNSLAVHSPHSENAATPPPRAGASENEVRAERTPFVCF